MVGINSLLGKPVKQEQAERNYNREIESDWKVKEQENRE